MAQKSVMKHQFSRVPKADIPRSSFDRSHGLKTTLDAGYLVPVLVDEALPGDTFNLRMAALGRLATPIFPVMDNLFLDSFFFAVPVRLVWENWQKFNGEQAAPGDSTDYLVPTRTSAIGYNSGTIHDYFGLPIGVAGLTHSVLWHRAANLIWNEWFRDQNLQNPLEVPTDDGPDDGVTYALQRRGKRHDYFTSCLPWPQKGESVDLPLGTRAPVATDVLDEGFPQVFLTEDQEYHALDSSGALLATQNITLPGDPEDALYADLSDASAATINQLRQAFAIQKMLERDARGGTRYTEVIRAHFGVTSPDARLQRPEYLGGGSTPMNITPVPQTSQTDDQGPGSPQGNLASFGTVNVNRDGFTQSFTEHCLILGFVSIRADLTYQQGMDRMFSRQTRYDYYWPALSHIGEQAVLGQEIYADGSSADTEVFGYQERFAEYRYKPSRLTGLMRSEAAGSLDAWHLSQDFETRPVLNASFIQDNPPIERVIAVQDEPHLILDCYFNYRCARPMPTYGVPGLIDHF